MTHRANIHEAKTHFSKLLQRAHRGEEVIICRAGRDYVRLVPIRTGKDRKAGAFKGKISGDVTGPIGVNDDELWG